jgi:hypothetical protein
LVVVVRPTAEFAADAAGNGLTADTLKADMNVLLQILKVNPIREGVGKQSGNAYRMQDAECLILSDTGEVDQVGVLMLSKDQVGNTAEGTYLGSFAMRANTSREGGRKIEAVLTGLTPVRKTPKGTFEPVAASKAA